MATREQQEAAMRRRQQRFDERIRWFGEQVERGLRMSMSARLRLAAQLLRDKVVINISRPVTKYRTRTGRTGVRPESRSNRGEFPKADTTRLMKDIFYEVQGDEARVGTTLDYGLILELFRDREFLRRTLREMRPQITRILTVGQTNDGAQGPN